jgi:hypothetical protein
MEMAPSSSEIIVSEQGAEDSPCYALSRWTNWWAMTKGGPSCLCIYLRGYAGTARAGMPHTRTLVVALLPPFVRVYTSFHSRSKVLFSLVC